ncbi:MAG: N2,N2-dimethylguanosine tRNA methyltransferase, partial [Cyanobacteriota bacterium]
PLRVLEARAGGGSRARRYGQAGGAPGGWANDADPDRLPLLQANLRGLPPSVTHRITAVTAQHLFAGCLQRQERFELVDLDAFGCPSALVPLALEAVALEGVLYLASTDGRAPTGHDRPAAIRRLGAAARAHPASWELALRLQLGVLARAAWAMGRGMVPLFSFSEGRTFRTAVRLTRSAPAADLTHLGLIAHCHGCGDQQVQSLLQLGRWTLCDCAGAPAVSGPLWTGALQDPAAQAPRQEQGQTQAGCGGRPRVRLLQRLAGDPGLPARCWPVSEIARRLGSGPPRLEALVASLREQGFTAGASGVMEAQVRSDAPWSRIVETARQLGDAGAAK